MGFPVPASARHADGDGRHPGDLDRQQAAFYYDLCSPDAYVAAERVVGVLGAVPEFVPVRIGGPGGFRCAEEEAIYRSEIERRAARHGLMPLCWPAELPADTEWAMLVATYAKQTGRVVAYSMAAFRQAFAAGRDLTDPESVMIAAAACELHPRAVEQAAARAAIKARLREATDEAADAGVFGVPSLVVAGEVFWGDDRIEEAADAAAA
jgi:2-hydroxychromene-2-carboxylate isomerase